MKITVESQSVGSGYSELPHFDTHRTQRRRGVQTSHAGRESNSCAEAGGERPAPPPKILEPALPVGRGMGNLCHKELQYLTVVTACFAPRPDGMMPVVMRASSGQLPPPMNRLLITLAAVALGLMFAACGPSNSAGTQRSQSEAITAEEIVEYDIISNAYEAVRRLRPMWLRTRGAQSVTDPSPPAVPVYVDGVIRYGGTENALRAIPALSVRSIQRLTAQQAQNRFGRGHTRGAFVVELR